MNPEKISVIVPVYNLAEYLPRCLESILAQTHYDLEVIVVDDGSKDDSFAVMQQYVQKDTRIKAIRQENAGVTSARLRGIAEATGDWIGFVDGDDALEPSMYARLLENAKSFHADISHCGYQRNYADGDVEYHFNTGVLRKQDHLTGLRDLLEERLVEPGLCSKLFRRSLFSGLAEKMDSSIKNNEDMLMNYFLFARAEVSVHEDVCPYHYILRQGSASRRKLNEHRIYDPIRVREIIFEQCAPELKDDAKQALLRAILYIYALLTVEQGKEYGVHRRAVRKKLIFYQDGFRLLTKRNQILARMIQFAPWVFHLAFNAYVKLALHGEYQ